jgi:Leu/Phe-tRNA-protein transferase
VTREATHATLVYLCKDFQTATDELTGTQATVRHPTETVVRVGHYPFKDEAYLFYIRTQCVPRCKHSPLQL